MATQGKATGGERSAGKTRKRGKLNTDQLRFVDEYMKDRNCNAAALRCGYSEGGARRTGNHMLDDVLVRAEIERREHRRAERADVETDDILRDLKRIAYFDMRSLWDPVTRKLRTDPLDLGEDTARGLVNFDIIVLGKTGQHIVKLNPGNKLRALELLGKHNRLFSDRIEHSGQTKTVYMMDFVDSETQ